MSKISLRPQKVSDAKRFFEIINNPNFKFLRSDISSVAEEREYLQKNAKKRKDNTEHNFSIVYDNKLVGGTGIKINQNRKYIGEIGYFIDEAYWGRGIATQSVRLLEKIGFTKLNLIRIEIIMDIKNKASERVAIKAGYHKEGLMRKVFKRDGKYHDCYLYAKVK